MSLVGSSSVDHVAFNVPDLDAAAAFLYEVFGAVEIHRGARSGPPELMAAAFGVGRGRSFRVAMLRLSPNLKVELFEWNGPAGVRLPGAAETGGHHLCFSVDDVDAAHAELARHPGIRLLGDVNEVLPPSPLAGTRWAYFEAPWGLRMELVGRAPTRTVTNYPEQL